MFHIWGVSYLGTPIIVYFLESPTDLFVIVVAVLILTHNRIYVYAQYSLILYSVCKSDPIFFQIWGFNLLKAETVPKQYSPCRKSIELTSRKW